LVSEGTPQSSSDGEGEDLLNQWQERLRDGENPMAALAEVLSGREEIRRDLLNWRGREVMGYELNEVLGVGGSGVTYEGVGKDGSRVAVKLVVLASGVSGQRFVRECELLEDFSHDLIVGYRAHQISESRVGVLVMELVDGKSLEGLLSDVDRGTRDHPAAAALFDGWQGHDRDFRGSEVFRNRIMELLAHVADGLAACHERGVVHRDVKPDNILIGGDLSPTLIDFGFARDLTRGSDLTMSFAGVGTLGYMAPEQARSGWLPVGHYTDTYGLGVVLYRALLGHLPYADLEAIASPRRRRIRFRADSQHLLGPGAKVVLERSLRRDPRQRYDSAAEFAKDLRAVAAGKRIKRRFQLWPVPLVVMSAAALLIAAVCWLVIGTWTQTVDVCFVANCLDSDAVVEIDGVGTRFLDDEVALRPGVYDVRLIGEEVASVKSKVHIESRDGSGVLFVPLLTQYIERSRPDHVAGPQQSILHFMSGHSLLPVAPGADRDERHIDGVKINGYGPYEAGSLLSAGQHLLAARDGKGRTESQVIQSGSVPLDVQLLPSVMSGIDGDFRLTWSTILSPLPSGLTVETSATRWYGPAEASTVGGAGLMALPCSYTAAVANTPSEVLVTVDFPELMKSAVVFVRAGVKADAKLDLEASLGDDMWSTWPTNTDGSLQRWMELSHPTGSDRLQLRARLSSAAKPSRGRTNVEFLHGVTFGGHWRDEPPCLAIVADPSSRSRLQDDVRVVPLTEDLRWSRTETVKLPPDVVGRIPGSMTRVAVPDGNTRMIVTTSAHGDSGSGVISELRWPELEILRSVPLEVPLGPAHGGGGLEDVKASRVYASSMPHPEVMVAAHHYPRAGMVGAGLVAMARLDTFEARWRGPTTPPSGPFGDEGFGTTALFVEDVRLKNAELREGVLVVAPGHRDATGARVGGLVLLDREDGRVAWRHQGSASVPFNDVAGAWHEDGRTWVLIASDFERSPSFEKMMRRAIVFPLDDTDLISVIDVERENMSAVACVGTAMKGAAVVSCVENDAGVLDVRRSVLSNDGISLELVERVALPDVARPFEGRGHSDLAVCPDLDGDGFEDALITQGVSLASPGRPRAVVCVSSRSAKPLAWCMLEPQDLKAISSILVMPDKQGRHQLVVMSTTLDGEDQQVQMTKFRRL